MKSNILNIISEGIYYFVMFLGVIALAILFHELYHLHLDGKPTGVCFGSCYVYNTTIAPASISWDDWVFHSYNEERNAWVFAFVLVFAIIGFLFWNEKLNS